MLRRTQELWDLQNRHDGDRLRLFGAVHDFTGGETALYPGSFVDIAASAVYPRVVYVDLDKRARAFFADEVGVDELLTRLGASPTADLRFIHGDYNQTLDIADQSCDVLISLYAGFVSEHCTRYLKVGGYLLANPSHGDVAMAVLDERYELAAVVNARSGDYRIRSERLDGYLVLKSGDAVSRDELRRRGRGVAYTKQAFAYLFRRTV